MSRRLLGTYPRVWNPRRVPNFPVEVNPNGPLAGAAGVWLLNDGRAVDLSGHGNNGTLVGGPAMAGTAMGPALSFNGNNYITVSPAFQNVNAFFVSFWLVPNAATGAWAGSWNGNAVKQWGFRNTNPIQWEVRNAADSAEITLNSINLTLGQLYHVVGVADGTTVYTVVNGVATPPSTLAGPYIPVETSTPWFIARDTHVANGNGIISNVQVYARAPRPGEIAALYARPFTTSGPNASFRPVARRTYSVPSGATPTALAPASGIAIAAGAAPSITYGTTLRPAAGLALASGIQPAITYGTTLQPEPGVAIAAGIAPSITWGVTLQPSPGAAIASGLAPTVIWGTDLAPLAGIGIAAGIAPTVSAAGGAVELFPGAGAAYASGIAPSISNFVLSTMTTVPAFARATTVPAFTRTTTMPAFSRTTTIPRH